MGVMTVDGKEFGCHTPRVWLPHSKEAPYAVVRSRTCGYYVLAHVTVSPRTWYLGSVTVIIRRDTAGGVIYNVPR